jgi:AraC-like DNA-binding protein
VIPAICLLGFLGSILLLNFADKVNPANRYLGYHFFLNALFGIAHWATVVSDSDTLRAIFTIHYFPVYLLNTPFLYFYVRAVLTDKIYIKGWDYIHFLPFVLILMNIFPYAIQPWAFKLNFAYKFHKEFSTIYQIQFPFVSFPVYFISRSLLSLAYIGKSGIIVFSSLKRGIFKHSMGLKNWLFVCLVLATIFNLSLIAFCVNSLIKNDLLLLMNEDRSGRTVATILMSALTISIYFFPKILYGLQFNSGGSFTDVVKLNEELAIIAKTPELSKARIKQVETLLKSYLLEKRYLTPGFSMSELVKDIGTPEHVLTFYFNNHKGITFLKWKNQLRIEEAVQLLRAGTAEMNTLESVGKTCGYKSRSNFIQAFKAQTGESPSVYLKNLR